MFIVSLKGKAAITKPNQEFVFNFIAVRRNCVRNGMSCMGSGDLWEAKLGVDLFFLRTEMCRSTGLTGGSSDWFSLSDFDRPLNLSEPLCVRL